MDPLSVLASVTGLVAFTAQTLKITRAFINDAKHGKQQATEMLRELTIIHFNLSRLSDFLRSPSGVVQFQDTSVLVSTSAAYGENLKLLQEKLFLASKSRLTPFKWPLTRTEHLQAIDELRAYAQCIQLSLTINGCVLLSKTSEEVVETLRNQLEAFQLLETINRRAISSEHSLAEQAQILQDHHEAAERDKILESISTFNHELEHNKKKLPRVEGTGDWFITSEQFKQWRDNVNSDTNILLCEGIQGCGKSVLA